MSQKNAHADPISGRTDRPTYFLDLALRCAQQGTCIRRNSGAVIVDGTPGGRSTHA